MKKGLADWRKVNDVLYISKFTAFRDLIHYLRNTKRPGTRMVERYIKKGIYGYSKNKYSARVQKNVVKIMERYKCARVDLNSRNI